MQLGFRDTLSIKEQAPNQKSVTRAIATLEKFCPQGFFFLNKKNDIFIKEITKINYLK